MNDRKKERRKGRKVGRKEGRKQCKINLMVGGAQKFVLERCKKQNEIEKSRE